MVIKVKELKQQVEQLNKLIDGYNTTILNLYNELLYSENYWQDNHSLAFYNDSKLYKVRNLNVVSELKEIEKIYTYLVDKYGEFGNKIECVLSERSTVNNAFDKYLNKMNYLIGLYNSLDLSFCTEATYLNNELLVLKNCYKKISNVKNNINGYFDKIEAIERDVNLMISRIDISYLKESEISQYL